MSLDLPEFIDDEVALAGISSSSEETQEPDVEHDADVDAGAADEVDDGTYLRAVDDADADDIDADGDHDIDHDLAEVISIESDLDGDVASGEADEDGDEFGGTFLAEVRAAAEDDDLSLAPEDDDSDRFLSELRGIAADDSEELNSDAADTFFDDENP